MPPLRPTTPGDNDGVTRFVACLATGDCAGCSCHGAQRVQPGCREAERSAACAAGHRRHRATRERPGRDRAARAHLRQRHRTGALARRRHRGTARIQGGKRRQAGPAPLPDRPRALRRRPEQRKGGAAEGAGQPRVSERDRRALQAARRAKRGEQAGLRQCRRGARTSGGRCRGRQGRRRDGEHQPRLHRRRLAHLRAHRHLAGDPRRLRAGEPGNADDDGTADRPDQG